MFAIRSTCFDERWNGSHTQTFMGVFDCEKRMADQQRSECFETKGTVRNE